MICFPSVTFLLIKITHGVITHGIINYIREIIVLHYGSLFEGVIELQSVVSRQATRRAGEINLRKVSRQDERANLT
jgi:hypothetical protein